MSSCAPRTRTIGDGAIVTPSSRTEASKSNLFLRAKCVSLYFSRSNLMPCVEAYARYRSCAVSRAIQFTAVDSLYVSRLTSSAKSIVDRRNSGRSSALSSGAL